MFAFMNAMKDLGFELFYEYAFRDIPTWWLRSETVFDSHDGDISITSMNTL